MTDDQPPFRQKNRLISNMKELHEQEAITCSFKFERENYPSPLILVVGEEGCECNLPASRSLQWRAA